MKNKIIDVLDVVFPPSVAFPTIAVFISAHLARARRVKS